MSQIRSPTILWTSTKCADLLKNQEVVEIDSQVAITDGCEVLVKKGISSAPVWNEQTKSYMGMLDYRDLVDFVLIAFRKKRLSPIAEEDHDTLEELKIDEIVYNATVGDRVTASVVAGIHFLQIVLSRSFKKESVLQCHGRVAIVCSFGYIVVY